MGSFVEEYNNKVQIVSLDENAAEFAAKSTFDHPYPTTKIMWIPDTKGTYPDLLATSGDYLRVWRAGEPETRQECLLNNNKNSDFCAPLTSFDWNEVDPNLLGTSSIDTTCTIWGLETGQVLGRVNMVSGHVKTQLIAHDKEVYDIAFSKAGGGRDMFASVGADGMFFKGFGDNLIHYCLVLLWVQNDFGPSKLFWTDTNCFGQVKIILFRFMLDFSGLIFMIWTCPK